MANPRTTPEDEWIGRRIRELRTAYGLTQEKLAFEAGVDKGHLSRLERGLQSPTVKTLTKIAARLGVPLSELMPSKRPSGQS